ncbi:YbhB/YbcL family Raf kinase inhibitor-like protein [Trinickia sp. LjRoot230]|uniref:YbhB/YbcL family Raf kinase inhibitor-like protein n=1 Tax=Trinickia sp. LjRoot230 TaxID=3342288 RepID=UPI003F50D40D
MPFRGRRAAAWVAIATLGIGLGPAASPSALSEPSFTLASTDLQQGKPIDQAFVYDKNGCGGKNRSPQLQWRDAPAATKAFAVTMFDLDAPAPGWWHWAIAVIPATVRSLPTNASASGFLSGIHAIEARNDYDSNGYGGPCPPPGKPHRYVITVYALGTTDLRLAAGRPAIMFDHEIGAASLGKASITVIYGR